MTQVDVKSCTGERCRHRCDFGVDAVRKSRAENRKTLELVLFTHPLIG